ncbi:mobile element transfer protein [Streptomyces brevispora]
MGTHRDRHGTTKHAAVCGADGCGLVRRLHLPKSAAQLAARTHRCKVR